MNGGGLTHILAWQVGPFPCRNPKWVKHQHLVSHTNPWWLFIWIPELYLGDGHVIFQHNLCQNSLSPGWMWWDNFCVSIVLGWFYGWYPYGDSWWTRELCEICPPFDSPYISLATLENMYPVCKFYCMLYVFMNSLGIMGMWILIYSSLYTHLLRYRYLH